MGGRILGRLNGNDMIPLRRQASTLPDVLKTT